MKNVIVSQVETIDWVTAITAVLKKRLTSDIASIGGAEFESYLSYNLSNKKYKVLTQKMIETLQRTDRAQLYFGDYTFPELMEESHHIGSDFYAVDLFAFTKEGDQYYYEDHISLKTSVSATDSSMFLVNDAEGVIVPSVLNGDDLYLGKVLMISVRFPPEGVGTYDAYYFDGYLSSVITGLTLKTASSNADMIWSGSYGTNGREVTAVKAVNRTKVSSNKQTSFARGLTVKTAHLSSFCDHIASGEFDVSIIEGIISDELMSL